MPAAVPPSMMPTPRRSWKFSANNTEPPAMAAPSRLVPPKMPASVPLGLIQRLVKVAKAVAPSPPAIRPPSWRRWLIWSLL
jgi:hypothetical protein